jgi:site-specific recombinase XerC
MSKRPSLFHQLLTALREQQRFGESKHIAKRLEICRAHANGRSGFGVAPRGIFSISTFAGYRQTCHHFATWCKDNGNPRWMADAADLVPAYIQSRIDEGCSAWTVQKDRSALRKVYKDPTMASEIQVPRRRICDIKRSRHPVKMDADFNPELHRDLVDFARGSGLRRHELAAVTGQDVAERGGRVYVVVRQGKGGKRREATVESGHTDRVKEIAGRTEGALFARIPKAMDVHSYRREYTQLRLQEAEEQEVTRDLGHERVDVMRLHYGRK